MDRAPADRDRFQFKLMHLFVLTTAIAIVMGLAVRLVSPAFFVATVTGAPKLFLLLVACYTIPFGGWLVLRGPRIYARWKSLRQRRREVAIKQAELQQMAAGRLRTAADGSDRANHPAEGS